jgi:hypothetical protein
MYRQNKKVLILKWQMVASYLFDRLDQRKIREMTNREIQNMILTKLNITSNNAGSISEIQGLYILYALQSLYHPLMKLENLQSVVEKLEDPHKTVTKKTYDQLDTLLSRISLYYLNTTQDQNIIVKCNRVLLSDIHDFLTRKNTVVNPSVASKHTCGSLIREIRHIIRSEPQGINVVPSLRTADYQKLLKIMYLDINNPSDGLVTYSPHYLPFIEDLLTGTRKQIIPVIQDLLKHRKLTQDLKLMRAQTQNQNNAPSKEEKVYFTAGVEEIEEVLNVQHNDPFTKVNDPLKTFKDPLKTVNDPELYLQGLIQRVLQSELQNVLKNVKMCRQWSVFDLLLRLSEVKSMPGIDTKRVMELKVIHDRDSRDCAAIRGKLDLNREIVELKRAVRAVVQTLPENERQNAERITQRLEIPNNQHELSEVFIPEQKSMLSFRNVSKAFKVFVYGTLVIIYMIIWMQGGQICEKNVGGGESCWRK